MDPSSDSESIRQAAKHANAAAELALQLVALHSFEEQGILDPAVVTDEIFVLATKYKTETEEATRLLKEFVDRRTNGQK